MDDTCFQKFWYCCRKLGWAFLSDSHKKKCVKDKGGPHNSEDACKAACTGGATQDKLKGCELIVTNKTCRRGSGSSNRKNRQPWHSIKCKDDKNCKIHECCECEYGYQFGTDKKTCEWNPYEPTKSSDNYVCAGYKQKFLKKSLDKRGPNNKGCKDIYNNCKKMVDQGLVK